MYLMRNHDVWIYVRCANSDPRIAFDRLYDLIDEAAGHGSERLVCGDCGSSYKRVTWSIHGRKQIVWRCVNRLHPLSPKQSCIKQF